MMRKLIFFSLVIFFTTVALSQTVNDALRLATPGLGGANARALGMGNAYLGLSDDASAMYFNPAGLGLLKRLEFSGGFNYNNVGNNTTYFGTETSYSNSNTSLNRLSFAFPFPTLRGSLVFGLSYHQTKDLTHAVNFDAFNATNQSMIQYLNIDTNIPYDLFLTDDDYNTPIAGRLRQQGDILSSGSLDNWTLTGAIEVYRNLYLGASFNIISGTFESINDYYEIDEQNIYQGETAAGEPQTRDFQLFHLSRILNWDIGGWDAKLGILYQLKNNARVGFAVQFPKSFALNETFTVAGRSEFGTGQVYRLDSDDYSDRVEYIITTPFELSAGGSVNFSGLILSAEGTLTDYSQIKFSNERGLTPQFIADRNKLIRDQLGLVFRYNAGIEYTIASQGIRFRAGFIAQPSPYRNDPAEFDRKYLTGGIGFLIDETIGLDLGYAYGWWEDIGDNYGDGIARTYQKINVNNLMLSATYRF
jgi:long-subunit fatty acid transport protein